MYVNFRGKEFTKFTTGSSSTNADGTTSEDLHYHQSELCIIQESQLLLGNVYKTHVMVSAGDEATFNPPTEGYLFLQPNQGTIIIQVMHDDGSHPGKLIGEIYVQIDECVGRNILTVPLTLNGKASVGNVSFQLDWNETRNRGDSSRCVTVKITRAYMLKSQGWFGKNNVFVQAYVMPINRAIEPNKPLPEAPYEVDLPVGTVTFPFSFKLPSHLPSSLVVGENYIAYWIDAKIESTAKTDPYVESTISVMAATPAQLYLKPVTAEASQILYPRCCIPPLCCVSFALTSFSPLGDFSIRASTDREGYAPGENIVVKIDIDSSYPRAKGSIRNAAYGLIQTVCTKSGHSETEFYKQVIRATKFDINNPQLIINVPSIAPTYDETAAQVARKYLITWKYELYLQLNLALPGIELSSGVLIRLMLPIKICGLGLCLGSPAVPSVSAIDNEVPQFDPNHLQGVVSKPMVRVAPDREGVYESLSQHSLEDQVKTVPIAAMPLNSSGQITTEDLINKAFANIAMFTIADSVYSAADLNNRKGKSDLYKPSYLMSPSS